MLITAYAGVGKTTLVKKYPKEVFEEETLMYEWIYLEDILDKLEKGELVYEDLKGRNDWRVRNKNFPTNYVDYLENKYGDLSKKELILLIPPNKLLYDELNNRGYTGLGVYPTENRLDIYKERFINRGNGEDFIKVLIGNFNDYKEMIKGFSEECIEVTADIYLEDVLKERNILN